MSQLITPFNPMQYDPSQSAGSLPIGKHPVVIESDEVKGNKNNDGGYLQLNLRIIDGPQTGCTGPYRLNLYHNNPTTVEIAHKQLSAICHVVNVFQLGASGAETAVLHNIPFIVEVGPQKNDVQYTEIKKVFDINGNEPGKGGQGAAPAQTQQPQQQQPAAGPAAGAWGGGAQPQQNQPQQGAAWGGAQPQNAQPQGAQPQTGAAWGGGAQQQQPAQQQPQQGATGAAWQQNQPAAGGPPAGGAPWGQK